MIYTYVMKRFIIHQYGIICRRRCGSKRICNVIEEHENRRHKTNQPSIQRGAIKEPNEVVQSFVSEK